MQLCNYCTWQEKMISSKPLVIVYGHWWTWSYLPHAGLYNTMQPNNDIMPTTAWSSASSGKMSMPWLYFLTFYNDTFIQFSPSTSTQKQTENIKSKRVEEATWVSCVMQIGQQRAIFHILFALLFQSKVENTQY